MKSHVWFSCMYLSNAEVTHSLGGSMPAIFRTSSPLYKV